MYMYIYIYIYNVYHSRPEVLGRRASSALKGGADPPQTGGGALSAPSRGEKKRPLPPL